MTMTRGGTTQVRTFTYGDSLLLSATNPETGTVQYQYNETNQLIRRTNANGRQRRYYYDEYGRLSEVRKVEWVGYEIEVTDIRYYYDSNPFDGQYTGYYAAGKLAAVTFDREAARYDYAYDYAGRRTGKRFTGDNGERVYAEARGYDREGKLTTMTHPDGAVYNFGYDAAGRLNAMTRDYTTVASVTEFASSGQWKQWTHDGIVSV